MRLKIIIETMLYDTISGNCESLIINFSLNEYFSGLRNLGVIQSWELGIIPTMLNVKFRFPYSSSSSNIFLLIELLKEK
jgi:hypothetical protein